MSKKQINELSQKKNDILSESYSGKSIYLLLYSAAVMIVLLVVSSFPSLLSIEVNYILPSSISLILFTASFVCSSKSKIYLKLAEEKEVVGAVKVNASDRIDKLLHFKWPFEKAVESVNDGIRNGSSAVINSIKGQSNL